MTHRTPTRLVPRAGRAEPAAVIRHDDRATALRIASILRNFGGLTSRRSPGRFEFATAEARDRAIDAARGRHGWTCVEAAGVRGEAGPAS